MKKIQNNFLGDVVQISLADIAQKDPGLFQAPEPVEAFEAWWGSSGLKNGKSSARKAWYAALKEMGCFDEAGQDISNM